MVSWVNPKNKPFSKTRWKEILRIWEKKPGEDRLRLSGQRAKEGRTESKDNDCGNPLVKNISSLAFGTVVGKFLYTAGKILALPLMSCVLISFICFPRPFPSKQGHRVLLGWEPRCENPVRWLKFPEQRLVKMSHSAWLALPSGIFL